MDAPFLFLHTKDLRAISDVYSSPIKYYLQKGRINLEEIKKIITFAVNL